MPKFYSFNATALLLVILCTTTLPSCQSRFSAPFEYDVEATSGKESSIKYVGDKGGTDRHYVSMRSVVASVIREAEGATGHSRSVTKEVEGPGILTFRYKETPNSTVSQYLLPR